MTLEAFIFRGIPRWPEPRMARSDSRPDERRRGDQRQTRLGSDTRFPPAHPALLVDVRSEPTTPLASCRSRRLKRVIEDSFHLKAGSCMTSQVLLAPEAPEVDHLESLVLRRL